MLNQEQAPSSTFSKKKITAAFCMFSSAAIATFAARGGFSSEGAVNLRGSRMLAADMHAPAASLFSKYITSAEGTDLDIQIVNFAPTVDELFTVVNNATSTLKTDDKVAQIFATVNFADTNKMALTEAAALVALAADDLPELPLANIPNYPTFNKLPFTYFKTNHMGKTLPPAKIKQADQIISAAVEFYAMAKKQGLQLPKYQEGVFGLENSLLGLIQTMQAQNLPVKSNSLDSAKDQVLSVMPSLLATKTFALDFCLMQAGTLQLIQSVLAKNPNFKLSYAETNVIKKLKEQVNSIREALATTPSQVAQFMLIMDKAADYAKRGLQLSPSARAAKMLPEFANAFVKLRFMNNATLLQQVFTTFNQKIDLGKDKAVHGYLKDIDDGIDTYQLQNKYHADINKYVHDANYTKDVNDGFGQLWILTALENTLPEYDHYSGAGLIAPEQRAQFAEYYPSLQILANQALSKGFFTDRYTDLESKVDFMNKVFWMIRILIDDKFTAGIMANAERTYDLRTTLSLYWLRANQDFVLSELKGIKAGALSANQRILLDVMYKISYGVIFTIDNIVAEDKRLKP